ncbi:MAG: ABC transporter permease [Acidobacteriota bacterium]|nr:ABC transporter permease [Acidobacteriota bacterium]
MKFLSELFRDFRFAGRYLAKTPVVTAIAVLALALGIGVNASSFIATNGIILHPFPFPKIERIAVVSESLSGYEWERSGFSPASLAHFQDQNQSFEQLAVYRRWNVNFSRTAEPERVRAYLVSPSFFSLLGIKAERGRVFGSDEAQPARSNVAVVSQSFWRSQLGGSRDAIDRSVLLGPQRYTIIGVMPDAFDFPLGTQIWAPLVLDTRKQHDTDTHDLAVLGLLKPNSSIGRANGEAAGIASRFAQLYPASYKDHTIVIELLRGVGGEVTERFIATVLGAAGFVLLLACANIGNLQLARAANRQKEIAVRAALGATQFQVARQLLAESVLLSLIAGCLGLFLASWNNDHTKLSIPAQALRLVPGLRTMHVDFAVVCYTLLISVVAGVLCSLPSIAQLAHRRMRVDLTEVLRDRSGSNGAGVMRNRLRGALIVFEIALALVLLIETGLMVKTFQRLLHLNQGFDPKNVLTLQVSVAEPAYDKAATVHFYDQALESFAELDHVRAAGLSYSLGTGNHLLIEGQAEPRPGEPRPQISAISANYLAAMRIPLLSGRTIAGSDRLQSQAVVVVSDKIARHYWPTSNAVGHRIKFDGASGWLTIVGVCGDVIDDWFTGQPSPAAYVSYAQFPGSSGTFVLRTIGDPMQAASGARAQIRRLDKSLAVYELESMEQHMTDQRSGVRAAADTMTTYSAIALLLAVTGIYAVVSYLVASRTHDIGVRIALGASSSSVLKTTLGRVVWLIALGVVLGVLSAYGCARIIAGVLYGVVDIDWKTFAMYAVVLSFSALLASYLPSRRATAIDPLTALREE